MASTGDELHDLRPRDADLRRLAAVLELLERAVDKATTEDELRTLRFRAVELRDELRAAQRRASQPDVGSGGRRSDEGA